MRRSLLACCLVAACTPDEHNLGFTPVGAPRWAVALGSAYDDSARAVAFDSIGDVVAGGGDQGPTAVNGVSSYSGFVTKRAASDGSERWTVPLLSEAMDASVGVASVAIDAQDSVIVTGGYRGMVDFGGQTLGPPIYGDTFVAKYTRDGHLQWVRDLDETPESWGTAVTTDSAGRIIVVGQFDTGTLTFGADSYTADSDQDAFIAVFDPSGTLVWGRAFQGAGGPYANSVAVAANDDVIVGGAFVAPASFGGATLDPAALARGYLARYRNDGLFLWSRVIGAASPGESEVAQVAAKPSGIVVQTVDSDGEQGIRYPAYGVVRALDDSGQEMWSRKIAVDGNINSADRTLMLAPSGPIVSSTWDDNVHSHAGSMVVVSYDATGHASTMEFGSRSSPGFKATLAWGSAVGATGASAYVGQFSGQVDLGTGPLSTHGQNDTDAYIVLLDPPM
jgi:hypothetical protein